jgi:transposase
MTRTELEARRLQAIPDLENLDLSMGKVARILHVSRTTIYRWRKARAQGSSLHRRKAPGRPCRMTAAEMDSCRSIYQFGPLGGGKWTQTTFAQAILDNIGVEYSPDHVGRIMHKLGLTEKRKRRNVQ